MHTNTKTTAVETASKRMCERMTATRQTHSGGLEPGAEGSLV
jgi:hypothetical protein